MESIKDYVSLPEHDRNPTGTPKTGLGSGTFRGFGSGRGFHGEGDRF